MIKPLVGVMMPVFNGIETISKSLKSLKEQTFENWICVIINDGSTDGTSNILQSIEDERFVIINLEKNEGRGMARHIAINKLIELNVKYICMLDADDCYYIDKLKWQVDYMDINKDLSLVSASVGIIDSENNLTCVVDSSFEDRSFFFNKYKEYRPVSFASSIFRASDLNGISFDKKMKFAEDQDFLIRFLLNKNYASISRVCYIYSREQSFSIDKYKRSLSSELYTLKKIGLSPLSIIKKRFFSFFKFCIVSFMYFFGAEQIYLSRIGRLPNNQELKEFDIFKRVN